VPYFYEYQGDDQHLVVESDEPRPDLLEWAYWSEIPAPTKPKAASKPEPEPTPDPEPASDEPKPAAKPARRPRAKAGESE
jgi:hypothetical protein